MKLSKTTWSLFGLAICFYAFSWTKTASALAVFGVLFEIGMYASMFSDTKREKEQNSEQSGGED
jgi:hypothetical protein